MFAISFLELELWEILGVLGAAIYCGSYGLVAFDRMTSQSSAYYVSKLAAACLVLVSLNYSFNLAAALVQIFFILVSAIGIFRHIKRPRPAAARDGMSTTRRRDAARGQGPADPARAVG